MSEEVPEALFDQVVGSSTVPVVLEFYATWCGNCRRIAPTLAALGGEFASRVRLVKVNADEAPRLVARFGVTSTPTLFALADGQQVTSVVGAAPESVLRGLFEAAAQPPSAPVAWAPADACTLPAAEQPARLAEFDSLFASSLIAQRRESARWLRLRLAGGADVESAARELAARETECCSFFDFQVAQEDGEVVVDIRAPADKAVVLDGLAAQAAAARALGAR